jgi:hypothetical protein
MSRHRRLIALLLILALLAGLVLFDDRGRYHSAPIVATAVTPRDQPERRTGESSLQPGTPITILTLRPRRRPEAAIGDAFSQRDWTPPPPLPPPTLPAPPAPPQAPLLPFQFLGKQVADKQWTVFLGRQDRTYVIVVGDVIEDTYRVDSIEPPLLSLTYLPLMQPQTLSIGMTQ